MALGDWLGALSMGMGALSGSMGSATAGATANATTAVDANSMVQPEITQNAAMSVQNTPVQDMSFSNAGLTNTATGTPIAGNTAIGGSGVSTPVTTPTPEINQTGTDMKTKTPTAGTEESGLGKGLFSGENIMKTAQMVLAYKNDSENRKIKKKQINHNIKKDQNARDRTKSVKASMGYGSSLSGSDFKYV